MSDSDTPSGSIWHSLAHDPDATSPGTSSDARRDTVALAVAIAVAWAPAARTASSERSGTAKNPQPDPTSARTPIPASSCCRSSSTSPLRAVIDSCRRRITLASA